MKPSVLVPLLLLAAPAAAQVADPDQRGAYLSAQLGNGVIHGHNAVGYRYMRWRAGEVRAGRDLNPDIVGEDNVTGRASSRIDFVYYNEGHPDNNHRDGFALQYTYAQRIGAVTAELSAGPYSSMNTTTENGVQINQARYGILASAALRFPLDHWVRGAHLRLGYNHVWNRNVFHSDAVMLGIGRHFTGVPAFPESDLTRHRVWLGGSFGRSNTTQSNTMSTNSFTVQAKQIRGKWALSLTAVGEGDDGTRVDRRGLAGQFWFVQPLTEKWTATAGAGPYIAVNRRENNHLGVHALITLQFDRDLSERTKAFFAFHRVKTFREENDRDLFHLGVLRAFGR